MSPSLIELPTTGNHDDCLVEIDLTTGDADDLTSSEAGYPVVSTDDNPFIVPCSLDGGFWPIFTCALGFLALLFVDGICSSLFMLDSRFRMSDYLPSGMRTLEHLATIYLFRHFTEPFSCAYINRYGFRYCLFFGSTLSVTWIALLWLFENVLFRQEHFFLAAIGGVGMGMIKTSFSVLVPTLFVANRQTAQMCMQFGSVTGIAIVPAVTQYLILITNWQTALQAHLGLMCLTLMFWLFVATPAPMKFEKINDRRCFSDPTVAYNFDDIRQNYRPPTIADKIKENRQFWVRLLSVIPMVGGSDSYLTRSIIKSLNWLYKEARLNIVLGVRNVTKMFGQRTIGSRSKYRDDMFCEGDVTLFAPRLKQSKTKSIGCHDYMSMTCVYCVADEEKGSPWYRARKFPTASSRVLRILFHIPTWVNGKFLLAVASETLVHAACFVPFMTIKGQLDQTSSTVTVITRIVGCCAIFAGRGIGHLLHERSLNAVRRVPLYHVSMVLMANGLTLVMCAMATNDLSRMLPCFGMFGFFSGYYKSIQNTVLYTAFSVKKFSTECGQISLIRALSSCAGIFIAEYIQRPENSGRSALGNSEHVYVLAGLFMLAGSVCLALLERLVVSTAATEDQCPLIMNHSGGDPKYNV